MAPLTALKHQNCKTAEEWSAYFVAPHVFRLGLRPPKLTDIAPAPIIRARVNQDRWLADCPFCAGAELVEPANPVFICLSCGNATIGTQFLRVTFPRHRARIEELLDCRPNPLNRNWTPGETAAKLLGENTANGIEVI